MAASERLRLIQCIAVIFITLAMNEAPLFADNESTAKLEILIQKGLHKNKDKIREMAWNLTNEERRILAFKYSKQSFIPGVLNIVVGFGLGSYLQGDKFGGVVGTLGGIAFFTSLTGSVIYLANAGPMPPESWGWFVAAGITGIFYATFEILRPVNYARLYNEELFNALMAKENITFNVFPRITPVSDQRSLNFTSADLGASALVSFYF